jgi:hypothetical protein
MMQSVRQADGLNAAVLLRYYYSIITTYVKFTDYSAGTGRVIGIFSGIPVDYTAARR